MSRNYWRNSGGRFRRAPDLVELGLVRKDDLALGTQYKCLDCSRVCSPVMKQEACMDCKSPRIVWAKYGEPFAE